MWQSGGNGISDVNSRFRSVFSFSTNVVFDLWTPLVFGIISIYCHIPNRSISDLGSGWEKEKFGKMAVWYLFCALVANFGYTGNLGIIGGFANVFASFLCSVAAMIN